MSKYTFADYELDVDERIFLHARVACPLAPKVFETLTALVQRSGHLVSKDDLMKIVWHDTVVEENNLTQHIFTLRRLFDGHHPGHIFIETVPRRGYRFVTDVTRVKPTEAVTPEEAEIRPPGTPNLPRTRLIFATACILFLAFVTASFYRNIVKGTGDWSPENIKIKRLTDNGKLFGATVSSDGNSLAYIYRDGANYSLRLKNIKTDAELTVVPEEERNLDSPRFSPDGNFIFYAAAADGGADAFRAPIYGGVAIKIGTGLMSEFSVSPDGSMIAFPRDVPSRGIHQILIAPTDGGPEKVISECAAPRYYALWGPAPAWSPDGTTLTVVTGSPELTNESLVSIDIGSGTETAVNVDRTWHYIGSLIWAGPEELIISASEAKMAPVQLWKIEMPGGKASRVTNDLSNYTSIVAGGGPNRIVALQETDDFHLWSCSTNTNSAHQVTFGNGRQDGKMGVTFAQDGHILYTERDNNELDIRDIDERTKSDVLITKHSGRNFEPAVSLDNLLVAFVSDRSGADRIWIANRNGSDPHLLVPNESSDSPPERTPGFSPDGKYVYFLSFPFPRGSVLKAPVNGSGPPVQVTRPDSSQILPAVSPDGTHLAIGRNVNDLAAKIGVLDLNRNANELRYYDFAAYRLFSAWLPDSRGLVTIDGGNEGNNLAVHDLTTGEEHLITSFSSLRIERFAVSPDGKQFVLARGSTGLDAVLIER